MPNFHLTGWSLSDFEGPLADQTNNTTGARFRRTSVTLDEDAETHTIRLSDDDDTLEDGYKETGDVTTLTQDITLGGVTYPAGSHIEAEFQLTTNDDPPITFTIGRIGTGQSNSGENAIVFTSEPLEPGRTYQFSSRSDGPRVTYEELGGGAVCFTTGTRIATPWGNTPIEELSVGDFVLTKSAGPCAIRWIGRRSLSAWDLAMNAKLRPIRIRANALGERKPNRDLLLSPQHRLALKGWRNQVYFGAKTILAASHALVNDQTIRPVDQAAQVTYFHILLDDHHLVRANGVWAETLHLGPQAKRMIPPEQLEEIALLFPELLAKPGPTAAPVIGPAQVALLRS